MSTRVMAVIVSALIILAWHDLKSAGSNVQTLRRTDDPVVVRAGNMNLLLGMEIKRLSLMRWKGNGFEPVPFQVDEKGSATYWMHYYFPQDFQVGDEARILNILCPASVGNGESLR